MGRLILHIGTHKTGTTSIQHALHSNRSLLRRRGIAYPDYSLIGRKPHYAHMGVANALANDHPEMTPDDAASFFEQVARLASGFDATLISAESMYRQTLGDSPPQAVGESEYWAIRSAYIARVRELTGPAEIAIVLRRQSEFAESMYQEHVKVTRYGSDFRRFLEEFWFHFRYLDQCRAWAQHFENVRVIPFDAVKGDRIVANFLDQLELRPGRLAMVPSQNIGLPHDGVILKRGLNKTGLSREELARVASTMSSEEFRRCVRPGKRSFFDSAEHRQAFQASFRDDNRELAQQFCRGNDQGLFAEDLDGGLRYGDAVSPEDLAPLQATLDLSLAAGRLAAVQDAATRRRARRRRLAQRAEAAAEVAGSQHEPSAQGGLDRTSSEQPDPAATTQARLADFSSAVYWESRYRKGGTSGPGSYGRLADFKSEVLNGLLAATGAESVIDFGCGDGNQLAGLAVPSYLGLDVSPTILERCRARWAEDPLKTFMSVEDFDRAPRSADLGLSMDVIFHLVEDEVFERYMTRLFASSRRWVVIYSSDQEQLDQRAPHVRQRAFSPWIARQAPEWTLWRRIPNAFAFDPALPAETSVCDFHVFRR